MNTHDSRFSFGLMIDDWWWWRLMIVWWRRWSECTACAYYYKQTEREQHLAIIYTQFGNCFIAQSQFHSVLLSSIRASEHEKCGAKTIEWKLNDFAVVAVVAIFLLLFFFGAVVPHSFSFLWTNVSSRARASAITIPLFRELISL